MHETIVAEGEHELERPSSALAWSGLAAGLSMGFSLLAEGVLRAHLPEAEWRPLVAKLGYSVGFLIVILGRQQLFTENTLTPILPLLNRRDGRTFMNVARLWVIVLLANLVGAFLFAVAIAKTEMVESSLRDVIYAISRESVALSFGQLLWRGVFAGWLIALTVWLLPFAETARFWVIILLTYLIGVSKLSHVIAGSIEAYTLAVSGQLSWSAALLGYTVPSLIGNVIGGVALVACVNHAQVVAGEDRGE